MKLAKLVIGEDYSIGEKTFKKDRPQEVDNKLYEYLKDNPQFEVYEEDKKKKDEK
ncbi:YqbF domain-containing protein [Neobacillus sp. M.A.Huq-85]